MTFDFDDKKFSLELTVGKGSALCRFYYADSKVILSLSSRGLNETAVEIRKRFTQIRGWNIILSLLTSMTKKTFFKIILKKRTVAKGKTNLKPVAICKNSA